MNYGEFSKTDKEMFLYVQYLSDVCDLTENIYDMSAELSALDNYGVSSPRIKSTEEAKYKDPPKVYSDDAPINMIERKDALQRKLIASESLLRIKRSFCRLKQEKLAQLNDDERELIGYRYFDNMTLRHLGQLYYCDKRTIQRRLEHALIQLSSV